MTPIKLSELERLSKEATPGPWTSHRTTHDDGTWLVATYAQSNCQELFEHVGDADSNSWNDGNYIAEANPLTISRLCEALRIAHGALKNISTIGDGCEDYLAEQALTKINSLVDLS